MAIKRKTTKVTVSGGSTRNSVNNNRSFFEKLQVDLEKNNSFLNLVLGTLIVIVLGVLMFNYFNKPSSDLGPSQQATNTENLDSELKDVAKAELPGKYTIKEGDTLFSIAQAYFEDGYQYDKIIEANKLADGNVIAVGQVIDIPKLDETSQIAGITASPEPIVTPSSEAAVQPVTGGQGGAENQTIWGEKITSNTYTVQEGDWLSKISGRVYGDIYQYDKIAKANNIADPNSIEVGTVITIPQ